MLGNLLAMDPSTIAMVAIVAVLIVALVAMMIVSRRRAKKQEQDTADLIAAVKPGNKVKTIGGICGVVVEVDNEENTFVLETGTEQSGKCCIKFDKQAIYQTDAVVEKAVPEKQTESEPFTEEDKADETAADGTEEKEVPAEDKDEKKDK